MFTRNVGNQTPPNGTIAAYTTSTTTTCSITKSSTGGIRWVVHSVQWSYLAAPTAGNLTVKAAGVTLLDLDITAAGPGSIVTYKCGNVGDNLVVSLSGGGTTAKLAADICSDTM